MVRMTFFIYLCILYKLSTIKVNRLITFFSVCILAGGLASCSNKKESKDIIAPKIVKATPKLPVKMQTYHQIKDFKWIGNNYICDITRTPDDSLPMVTDESGQKFVDNRIQLIIKRKDGSTFFNKAFSKVSFDSNISDDYRKHGILEGLVFDRVEGDHVLFAASVSLPQTDEYIPLCVEVNRFGELSIRQDNQLDTSGDAADDEEEDI